MIKRRLVDRLRAAGIESLAEASPAVRSLADHSWLAIVSSHLGRSAGVHARVCQFLTRSMLEARRNGSAVLVASGSAIEPWVLRAAELFSVPLIHVGIGEKPPSVPCGPATIVLHEESLQRDEAIIRLADRVDCVYCRPRGTIDGALKNRLARRTLPAVRVAIHPLSEGKPIHRAALALMDNGALGWLLNVTSGQPPANLAAKSRSREQPAGTGWAHSRDEWLVHCTRAATGAWPQQSTQEHQDKLLLSAPSTVIELGTALASLQRIVRMRRLLAASLTSARRWPVVCFSALPLAELLKKRTYRHHLHRWDYEPYGIAIRKSAALRMGIRPAIYGDPGDRDSLAEEDQYRFQSRGTTYDWTTEREWRAGGDVELGAIAPEDVRVFVAADQDAARLRSEFPISVVGSLLER